LRIKNCGIKSKIKQKKAGRKYAPSSPNFRSKKMKKVQHTTVCGLVNQKWIAFRTHAQAIDAGAIRTVNTVKRDGHHWPRKASVMLAAVV
jgi:hypothetical protein